MPKLDKTLAVPDPAIKALVIYDDFVFAARVHALLERSAQQTNGMIRWSVKPWPVHLLEAPETAGEALAEAVDAHLVVFTGRCAQSPTDGLGRWLERWAADRRIADAALAAISDEHAGLQPSVVAPGLLEFAQRHGLNFIFEEKAKGEGRPPFFLLEFTQRDQPGGPITRRDKSRDNRPYRGWGINE